MKKILIVLIVVLMTLAGCGKGNNNNNNNKPTPAPAPSPTPTDNPDKSAKLFVSRLGTDEDVEKAMDEFNQDFRDWNAFRMYKNPDGSYECGVWDDDEIYLRNFESYATDGYMPIIYFVTNYEDGNSQTTIKNIAAWLPFENIEELPVGYEDAVEEFQEDLLHAIFPDLTDDQVDKLVEKLCLTDEEGFEAYRNHQAIVSDFEKTTVEVYPSQDSEKPYKITVEYDADHSTLLLSYLAE